MVTAGRFRALTAESFDVLPPLWEFTVTSASPLALLLRKLETHAALGEADRQAILSLPFTRNTLQPHAYIIREGDDPHHCAILLSGFAFRHKCTGDGARQIVALNIPGDALDFQNLYLDVSDHNVQTLTQAEVAVILRADVQNLALLRPSIGRAIMASILVEASIFREWMLNVGRRSARQRLAHLLCEWSLRLDAQGLTGEYGYELPMTQEQLADTLGLTPVHVNRTIKGLEADGLLVRDRRWIGLPDWERLRELGDFNERYLHLGPQKSGSFLAARYSPAAAARDNVIEFPTST
ncbi:MAG: Crp/Fnr family transcriptional regulator [Novosphingobium sp.]|nr:Crp/Fnr family transcriptional regulator [Novosphingobium sp.]